MPSFGRLEAFTVSLQPDADPHSYADTVTVLSRRTRIGRHYMNWDHNFTNGPKKSPAPPHRLVHSEVQKSGRWRRGALPQERSRDHSEWDLRDEVVDVRSEVPRGGYDRPMTSRGVLFGVGGELE